MTPATRAGNLALLVAAQVLALSLWFSGTVAGPAMRREAGLDAGYIAWLTGAVQLGFVLGTLISAALTLADRLEPRRFFALSAGAGALANGLILLLPPGDPLALALRFATGVAMAGIYPVGMKLAAGWARQGDGGLMLGLLVGGLVLGSASPHLLNALGGLDWRIVVQASSGAAGAAALLIGFVALGPGHVPAPPFRWNLALRLFRGRGTRLATLGYLGHMWELYAMWAWIGVYLAASFAAWGGAAMPAWFAPLASFLVMAAGAGGAVGAGLLADRLGRCNTTIWAMGISGACCLLAGPVFGLHPALVVTFGLVWGVTVVADSAQFSASVAELSEPGLQGTMLTVQTAAGFALTLVTIHLLPLVVERVGWGGGAFAMLAIGPVLGCLAMLRLRGLPESRRLAGGRG